ncbi:MAG: hypothetical protein GWN58_33890 [Anaerolineae bacterium]|nr:hypothetical protein [Thermoplasmata archaeon]NIV34271.1 hypothetical protein [Anaerolineae bacterium]NIY06120.1 hypothetical protein [Thermoplasmata archaeon]
MGYNVDGQGNQITRTIPTEYTFGQAHFQRDDGVEQMAVNGGSTVSEEVWDGDGTYWTRSGIGSVTTGAAHSGTNGLDTGVASLNDQCRFDYGSDRDLESSFDSIAFWMSPQAFPQGSRLRARWRTSGESGSWISRGVNIADYVSNFDIGVWQRVIIPLVDFDLTGNAGRFVLLLRDTAGQHFYFDDFEMLNSGSDGPYRYRVTPDNTDRYHISQIVLVVEAEATGWDGSAFADIAGGLESGLLLRQRRIGDGTLWSTTMKTNADLFGKLIPAYDFTFSGGHLMVTFAVRPSKADIVIDGSRGEHLAFVVRDDLSSLANVRAYAQYGVEHLPQTFAFQSDETVTTADGLVVV